MRKMLVLGGCLAVALAMGGCRTTNNVYVGDGLGGPPYRWVQVDDNLDDVAQVVVARQDRQNGLLRVQVEVQNVRRVEKRVVYRFVWLDEKGIEVTSIQNDWLPKILGGHETVQLTGIAPDTRVTQCIVKIQESLR